MKIYIDGIIYSLQKGGGITHYTTELIDNLTGLGHEVILTINSRTSNYKLGDKKLKTIELKSILKTNNRFVRFITYPFHKLITEIYLRKNKIRDGVFHSTYFTHYNNLKIPQIITIHDLTREKFPKYFSSFHDKIFLLILKNSTTKADAIICVSNQTAKDLVNYYKVDQNKISVIYLGVNQSYKTKNQNEKETFWKSKKISRPYILFVGKRSKYKNFELFIKAFADWKNKGDLSIITVGGGHFTRKEQRLIKKLKLENDIINFGFAIEEDLIMLYNCADKFIFPSLSEGFGLPLIEAMACGTQVLASDIPVFREIGLDIPIYFDPYNKESLIKALDISLIKNESKIKDGQELAKKFTWENTAKKTLEIYQKFIK